MQKKIPLLLAVILCLASSVLCMDLEYGIPQLLMAGPRVGLFSASHSSQVEATPLMGLQIEVPMMKFMKSDNEIIRSMGIGLQYLYESWPLNFTDYNNYVWKRNYSYSYLTFIGTYYYPGLKLQKLRPFCRLGLGFKTEKVSFAPGDPLNDGYRNAYNDTVNYKTGLCGSLSFGAKYFVVPNIAVIAEIGLGLSGLVIGADYCF